MRDAEIQRLSAEIEALRAEKKSLEAELARTMDELRIALQNAETFRRLLYGRKSEKQLPSEPSELVPNLFSEVLSEDERQELDKAVTAMEEQDARTITVRPHTRTVRKPVLSHDLPVKETHIYPEGVSDDYVEIGTEVTDRLAIIPAQMYIDRTVRHKFVLRSGSQADNPDGSPFLIAPLPKAVIEKSMASESILADILIDKYLYHLPFYRVIQKYRELGVVISDATINDWFVAVCDKLLPLYSRLRDTIMGKDYIQVDESTLPVIGDKGKRSVRGYMWAVRDALGGSVYFHYDFGSRSGETARALIGNYRGAIQTDGYEAYNQFERRPGIIVLGCWAHVRRKFIEAVGEDEKHAKEALSYISRLYAIEAEMREAGLDSAAIADRRRKESYPLILEFEKWLVSVSGGFLRGSRMDKAVNYAFSLMPRLGRYILDGRYQMDNNGVENAIRPLAVGRKNWLFCGNHDAAVRAGIVYSLFGSCKAAGIDVREWMTDILLRLPQLSPGDPGLNDLLPCNWRKSGDTPSK